MGLSIFDLHLKDNVFKFFVNEDSDDLNYIFYIIYNGDKILTKYSNKSVLIFSKDLIIGKIVTLQCYYLKNNTKIKKELKSILYVDGLYTRGFVTKDYADICEFGYKSFDKKMKINLNEINWRLTQDNNFNFNIHSLRFLSSFWGEYLRTYNFEIIKKALYIFMDFWNYININKINKFKTYDMAVGIRALHIYFLSNFIKYFNSSEKKFFWGIYNYHYNELIQENNITFNNHGIWQLYGLRMLILVKNDQNKDDLGKCSENLQKLLNFSFNEENLHVENSPMYHHYVGGLFDVLPKNLFNMNGKLQQVLKNNAEITSWLCDYKGNYFQIGDSHSSSKLYLSNYLKKYKPDMKIQGVDFYSKFYTKSGYGIVTSAKSENYNAFILSCTSDTLIHKHADNLSFILWHRNIELITDSGPYTYNYNDLRTFCVSDKAHNVVSLKDVIYSVNDIDSENSGLEYATVEKEHYSIKGVSSFKDFSYRRSVKYKPFDSLYINDYIVFNKNNSEITFNLTFGLEIEAIKVDNIVILQHKGLVIAKINFITIPKEINLFNGSTTPYRGWISKKYNEINPSWSLEAVYLEGINDLAIEIKLF